MIEKNIRVNNKFYVALVYNEIIEADKRIIFHNVGARMYGLGVPENLDFFMKQEFSQKILS